MRLASNLSLHNGAQTHVARASCGARVRRWDVPNFLLSYSIEVLFVSRKP